MIKLNLNEMELVAEAFLKHLKSVAFENFMVDTGDDFSLYQRMDAEDLSITMTFDKNGQRLEVGSRIPDGTTFVVEQKAGEDQVESQGVISGSFKLSDEQVAELEEMFGLNRQERVNLEPDDSIYDLLSAVTGIDRAEVKRQILQAFYSADAPPPNHPDPESLKATDEKSDKTDAPYSDDYAGIRMNGFYQRLPGGASTASGEITIPLDVIEAIIDRLFPFEEMTSALPV